MYAVLEFLRTIICSGVAFVIWWIISNALVSSEGGAGSLLSLLIPVWVAGLIGGAICSVFNARQGIMLAFTCGVLLAIGFLYVRHGLAGMPLGSDTLRTLWPLWFPPAFYAGAYGYIVVRRGF